jgi:hypothetical protein
MDRRGGLAVGDRHQVIDRSEPIPSKCCSDGFPQPLLKFGSAGDTVAAIETKRRSSWRRPVGTARRGVKLQIVSDELAFWLPGSRVGTVAN